MRLYYVPFACSLAVRAALDEAGIAADFVRVGTGEAERDFAQLNPLRQVPTLVLDDGSVLTEAGAILQYLADERPESGLMPAPGTRERYETVRWLSFTATELHKTVFTPLLGRSTPPEVRQWALAQAPERLDILSAHLDGREFLTSRYTFADAYLTAVLNWCEHAGVKLSDWPVLESYRARLRARPSIARAMQTEMPELQFA